ncbi:Hsp70 family protein [Kitasatospora arboriphila]
MSEATEVEDYFTPVTPASRVERSQLEALIGPLLDRTVHCCRELLAAHGTKAKEVDAVLLVGGTTRVPLVRTLLAERLNRPLRLVEDPDLAVVHGAAAWAARADERRLTPVATEQGAVPLAWGNGTPAELTEWHFAPGSSYPAGAALGTLRTPDGALLDLAATAPGRVVRQLRGPGETVAAGEWLIAVEQEAGAATAARETGTPPHQVSWRLWLLGAVGLAAVGTGFFNNATIRECTYYSSYDYECYEYAGYWEQAWRSTGVLLVVIAVLVLGTLAWRWTRRVPLARLLALPLVVGGGVTALVAGVGHGLDGRHYLTTGLWLLGLGLLGYFGRSTGRRGNDRRRNEG